MKTYEIINHTADIGIKIYGRTKEVLFINAATAMFDVMLEKLKKRIVFDKQKQKKFLIKEATFDQHLGYLI